MALIYDLTLQGKHPSLICRNIFGLHRTSSSKFLVKKLIILKCTPIYLSVILKIQIHVCI